MTPSTLARSGPSCRPWRHLITVAAL
ncbi:MAG: hypothetical protein RL375_4466, partial [Pseudomonadota bacterium]